MATKKTVWESDDGKTYPSKGEAELADLRYRATDFLTNVWTENGIDLRRVEVCNEESLEPVVDYFAELIKRSRERTNKHG